MSYGYPHPMNGSNTHCPQIMCSVVDDDYLYGTHIRLDGSAILFRYRRSTDTYETVDLSGIAGNQLQLPIYDLDDDHFALAMFVDADDVVHVMGNNHDDQHNPNGAIHHVVFTGGLGGGLSSGPSWQLGSEPGFLDDASADAGTYTYHLADRFDDGRVLWAMSQSETRTLSRGRDWLMYVGDEFSNGWTPVIPARVTAPTSNAGEFAQTDTVNDGVHYNRVYLTGLLIGADGRVHVAGIWRTGDEDATTQQAPFYLYSDDLITWRSVSGHVQTMPIRGDNLATDTAISSAPATSSAYRLGVDVDPVTNYPAVIVRNQNVSSDFRRLYWDGAAWQTETPPALAGEIREVRINGTHWYRAVSGNRLILRDKANSSQIVRIGGAVRTAGVSGYSANHCPVLLRNRGIYAVNVGNGNSPLVWTFGEGARVN